jgi:alkylation response protein AidB-like acyl-CoA dehydrogenase
MTEAGKAPETSVWRERGQAFAREYLIPSTLDDYEPPRSVYEAAFEAGLCTAMLPTDVGGSGASLSDLAAAAEEVAYGDVGVATSIFVTTLASGPLLLFGSEEQRQQWLPQLTRELSFCSFAWTEPEGSSNLFGRPASTVARRVEGGYELTGAKTTVTNAPVAAFFTVFAQIEGERGLTAFVVPRDAPGVTTRSPYRKHGQRASFTGEIVLDGTPVPDRDMIGRPGQGIQIATRSFARSRAGIGALAVGIARRARDLVVEHGHRRKAGNGKPLIFEQDFHFRVAQMDAEIEASRALTLHALRAVEEGRDAVRLSSCTKLIAGDMAVRVTDTATEMLGARGYLEDGVVEKLRRDAKALQIYEGPPAIQKMLIAEQAIRRSRIGKP